MVLRRGIRIQWLDLCLRLRIMKRNGLASFSRNFKLLLCVIALLLFYGFLWLFSRYRFRPQFVKTDRLSVCTEDRLKPFRRKLVEFDAFHFRAEDPTSNLLTVVGNGYIGATFQNDTLLLRSENLSHISPQIPVLARLDVHGYISDISYILDIKDGIMHRINCFKHEKELCVSSGTAVYAHRLYTSLLIQNFLVYNPLPEDVTLKLGKPDLRSIKGSKTVHTKRLKRRNSDNDEHSTTVTYQVVSVVVPTTDTKKNSSDQNKLKEQVKVVVLFEPVLPDSLTLESGSTQSYTMITGIRVSTHPLSVSQTDLARIASDHSVLGQERKALEALVEAELTVALQVAEPDLRQLHIAAWNRLWLSGLTLSYSHAPHALNGEQINATLYYLASASPDQYAADRQNNGTGVDRYIQRFVQRAECTATVHLVNSDPHWLPVRNINELNSMLDRWYRTLDSAQCGAYLEDGAHGVIQASLAAIASLRHREAYTSVGLIPNHINRDALFRRICPNHPGVYVNLELRVAPGEVSLSSPHLLVFEVHIARAHRPIPLQSVTRIKTSNLQPVLSQSLDSQLIVPLRWVEGDEESMKSDLLVWIEKDAEDVPVYVCPAACQGGPLEVGYSAVSVPFLVTQPASALIYIGTDETSLVKQVRGTQHSKIAAGPNPDHDIITLHRYGHAFGGLPWLFWVCLGLLITLFHLFFCKLIYNELVRDKSDLDAENAWSLPRSYTDLRSPEAAAARLAIKAELASRRRYYRQSDYVP